MFLLWKFKNRFQYFVWVILKKYLGIVMNSSTFVFESIFQNYILLYKSWIYRLYCRGINLVYLKVVFWALYYLFYIPHNSLHNFQVHWHIVITLMIPNFTILATLSAVVIYVSQHFNCKSQMSIITISGAFCCLTPNVCWNYLESKSLNS